MNDELKKLKRAADLIRKIRGRKKKRNGESGKTFSAALSLSGRGSRTAAKSGAAAGKKGKRNVSGTGTAASASRTFGFQNTGSSDSLKKFRRCIRTVKTVYTHRNGIRRAAASVLELAKFQSR